MAKYNSRDVAALEILFFVHAFTELAGGKMKYGDAQKPDVPLLQVAHERILRAYDLAKADKATRNGKTVIENTLRFSYGFSLIVIHDDEFK